MKWSTLWRFLRDRFRHVKPGKPAPTTRSPAELALMRERERREEQAKFILSLRRLIDGNPHLRSHLYLISLADFREAAAAKWARLVEKVALLTRAIIHRHIDKHGIFAQIDDETFVIALPTLSRQLAHDRVAEIARDLSNHLLGDQLVAGRRPLALAANMPFAEAVAAGRMNLPAILAAVDAARSLLAASAVLPKVTAAEVADHDRVADLLAGSAMPSGTWNKMPEPDRKVSQEWQCFSVGRPVKDPPSTVVRPFPASGRISVLWRPTWVAVDKGISAYCARVLRVDPSETTSLDGASAYCPGALANNLTLDRHVVAAAVAALQAPEAMLRGAALIVPICWSSLNSATRWSLTGPIVDLPSATRRDHLRIELFQLPQGVDSGEIGERISFLRGLGCESMVRLRPSSAPVGLVARSKVTRIGLDLAELTPDEQMGDEDLLVNLERFHQMAQRRNVGCFLWGVRRRGVIEGAIGIGYEMVNGPGLMSDIGQPAAMVPVPRRSLAAAV